MREDLIVYGGSFNPPTIAHGEIINYLLTHFKQQLLILPTSTVRLSQKTLAPMNDRIKMLKLVIAPFKTNRLHISALEAHHDFRGTVELLRYLGHPFFVIGADCLAQLPNWLKAEELLAENHFIVFKRLPWDIALEIANHPLLARYSSHFIIIDQVISGYSSASFRDSSLQNALSPVVLHYIQKKHLYEVKI